MNQNFRPINRKREGGQTLVVALIILGLLLILGFVFLGIINRNIQSASRYQNRSQAGDLAEAGIRYAQSQLLQSELGADWRGRPTELSRTADVTNDPDSYYLRPRPFTNSTLRFPGSNQIDLGGPDGLGPYIRVNFANGRSLVRVRYSPSDANLFASSPLGPLRNPGAVRNYTIIEAVGRDGRLQPNDPTGAFSGTPVQFRNYASESQLAASLRQLARRDGQVTTSRRLRAFASIGIIETARYITNKDKVSRPAELGIPNELGAVLGSVAVGPNLPMQIGSEARLYNPSNGAPTISPVPGFGGIYSNADLVVHGDVRVNLNSSLGDGIFVNGAIKANDDNAGFTISRSFLQNGVWTTTTGQVFGPAIDSRNPAFSTLGGLIRDARTVTDASGYSRGVGYKTPPSMLTRDSETGELRYVQLTRESGQILTRTSGGQTQADNSGRYGHGRGVYVDNVADRQIGYDEATRANVGSEESLVYDWLNPNNGQGNSGWQGPFYVPRGAFVQFNNEGFTITRDGRSPESQRFWKAANGEYPINSGAPVQQSSLRYRLGSVQVDGVPTVFIINEFTPAANFDSGSPDFSKGQPFNGVLFFEGNIRVRGVIPTDVQITLVSNATAYVEGSIVKGVLGNDVTRGYLSTPVARGARLTRPTRSLLMIMAKDYVAINSTQFFGPGADSALDVMADASGQLLSAIRMKPDGRMNLEGELALNPETGSPFAMEYRDSLGDTVLPTRLVLTQTMDDGPAGATFISMNVNPAATDSATAVPSAYYFPRTMADSTTERPRAIFGDNVVANYPLAGNPAWTVMFGLGSQPYQRYGNFETVAFPVVNPDAINAGDLSTGLLTDTGPEGQYSLFTAGTEYQTDSRRNQPANSFRIRPNSIGGEATNDYVLARAALVPHDVRIEASLYAETGAFFVIPGPWFNPNPYDTRAAYASALGASPTVQDRLRADRDRLTRFGTTPIAPFYGEPTDVRVSIVGSVSENMPPAISQQAEWDRKWAWIPRQIGAMSDMTTNKNIDIPSVHIAKGFETDTRGFVPNLTITYDPVLATARANGFVNSNDVNDPQSPVLRVDAFGRALPPMPRLPVSPTLAYFGEVN